MPTPHAIVATLLVAVLGALAGCATRPAAALPVETTIDVVERGWHTDICIRSDDADAQLLRLADGYEGSRFLCFGFGDRHYLLSRERGPSSTCARSSIRQYRPTRKGVRCGSATARIRADSISARRHATTVSTPAIRGPLTRCAPQGSRYRARFCLPMA